MTRFRTFTDRHPVIAMLIGWVLLLVIGLVILPADPPYVSERIHSSKT